MSENFTADAKKVIRYAEQLAVKTGMMTDSVHLLTALTAVDGYAAQILSKLGFGYGDVASYAVIGSSVPSALLGLTGRQILARSQTIAKNAGYSETDTQHILLALCYQKNCSGAKILAEHKITYEDILSVHEGMTANKIGMTPTEIAPLPTIESEENKFAFDLVPVAKAHNTKVFGREKETERILRILTRKYKNNPILVGEPGVGKTAIVEGLSLLFAENKVPRLLQGKKIFSVDVNSFVAGTKYRGDLEARAEKMMNRFAGENVILFFDEIHTLLRAGNTENGLSLGSLLKPALSDRLTVIGATTFDEYRKSVENDPAFARRFSKVVIEEPTEEQSVRMIEGKRGDLESHYGIRLSDDVVSVAVRLSKRYLPERFLPDKAIDLLEEGCAKAVLAEEKEVDGEQIKDVLTEMTGIPVRRTEERTRKLLCLEETLKQSVIGQEEGIKVLCKALLRVYSGVQKTVRPPSFLFIGPTGVGKTETAKCLARELFGSESAMIRLDMSEYSEKNSVAKLIGSPPGYVGYGEGGKLTEAIRRKPFSVVLLDEIEKAHSDLFNILLQVLDDGRLTDGQGRTADFRHALIVMTGNIGTKERKKIAGFGKTDASDAARYTDALKNAVSPEFLNRIDKTVVFRPLDKEDLMRIANHMIEGIKASLKEERKIAFKISARLLEYLVDKGFDKEYGARPLRRTVETEIEDRLGELILKENLTDCTLKMGLTKSGTPHITKGDLL